MKLITGIASTTHIDLHGDRLSKEGLENMAAQVNQKYIPLDFEHKQIFIGVILCTKVRQLEDGEWGAFFVGGIFENEDERQKYKYGERNTIFQKYLHLIDDIPTPKPKKANVMEKSKKVKQKLTLSDIESALGNWIDKTQIWTDGSVYIIKALVVSMGELKIYVYTDHNPAHFHVISKQRGIDARFDIQTLELISVKSGSIKSSDVKKIQAFFGLNKDMLDRLHTMHARLNPPN